MNLEMAALRLLATERDMTLEAVIQTLEAAMLSGYRQQVGDEFRPARVHVDRVTGAVGVLIPERDETGSVIGEVDDTPTDFGRIAAREARNVMFQRFRAAKDDVTVGSYASREGEIVQGTIQQGPGRGIHVDLGDVEAEIALAEQVPGERYVHGERIRAYVLSVVKGPKGPRVALSRTHPRLVAGLFAREVPEISSGQVEIVAIAREAGHRSKMAVRTSVPGLSAKGACVGPEASRVRAVVDELNGEKIDIAVWSEDPKRLLSEALSPARVLDVEVVDASSKIARVVVPDYQLSLAIGKEGQNARLAARLTGWKIDIRSDAETPQQLAR